jgi:long-chain acyl-CoA synthetase
MLRVVNEDGSDAGPSEVGEIIAYGLNIMKGYWNNETETKAIIKDGWLHTGDLATVDDEGYIYVKGRKDDMIKYLGHRISPLEIEAVINSCDQVLESAVVGIGKDHEKQIKAYIIPKYSVNEIDQIDNHVRKLLPPFKRPQLIEFVEEIPRTVNGKIKRSELRNMNQDVD